jgi:uncharacterized protein
MKTHFAIPFLLAALAVPSTAPAQFSESYNFLKAVRDRDGAKSTEILSKPGSVIIDTRDGSTGEAALHIVTKGRDLAWLGFLLGKHAKPDIKDADGNTPLMIAAQLRWPEGATLLLRLRAQVDVANSSGETPLIRAVQLRDAAMVRLLLSAGANPNKADTLAGMTARDYAKRDARAVAILKILEEPRAKPAAVSGPKL